MNSSKGKFTWSVKIGEKGQFVIPKEARELFEIKPGDTVLLIGDVNRGLAIPTRATQEKIVDLAMGDIPVGGDEEK